MLHFSLKQHNPSQLPVKVWVLAPFVQTNDENLDYYYDFSQSIAEYNKAFELLGLPWQWQPVTMDNFASIIDSIVFEKEQRGFFPVVFNICDGDELNGAPGISVVRLLQKKGLIYTGAEEFFYSATTSKIFMKKAFDQSGVANANWESIQHEGQDVAGIFSRLGSPIIVKPSISGGSMGVGVKNVVHDETALKKLIKEMFLGYRGWNLVSDGLVAESFITGPEYTCFIVGSFKNRGMATIYEPVERIFHKSLPENEKFLSFDRLWEIYEEETAMPNEENFYDYATVDPSIIEEIKKLSWDAFAALEGTGYTRIDLRRDTVTGKLFVLEANAQCGISEDEDYTSIGAILKVSGKSFAELVREIIVDAIERQHPGPVTAEANTQRLVNTSNAS
jgi:D-alanine-D-alanine ligase